MGARILNWHPQPPSVRRYMHLVRFTANRAAFRSKLIAAARDAETKCGACDAQIKKAAKVLKYGRVVAFTGAGASAESGVPTYRDPNGLWRKFDMKKVSHIRSFLIDPVACWRFELELYRLLRNVAPNDGHRALAQMEHMGILAGIVTQNVEGLHFRAGSTNVVELHGNELRALCLSCGERCHAVEAFRNLGWVDANGDIIEQCLPDLSMILRKESDHDESSSSPSRSSPSRSPSKDGATSSSLSDCSTSSSSSDPLPRGDRAPAPPAGAPICPTCRKGLLKPDATYFGEKLDPSTLKRAILLFKTCKVALLIGSTCKVAPASLLPLKLRKQGGFLVDVNPKGSRLSGVADVWLQGPSAEILPRLVKEIAAECSVARS